MLYTVTSEEKYGLVTLTSKFRKNHIVKLKQCCAPYKNQPLICTSIAVQIKCLVSIWNAILGWNWLCKMHKIFLWSDFLKFKLPENQPNVKKTNISSNQGNYGWRSTRWSSSKRFFLIFLVIFDSLVCFCIIDKYLFRVYNEYRLIVWFSLKMISFWH